VESLVATKLFDAKMEWHINLGSTRLKIPCISYHRSVPFQRNFPNSTTTSVIVGTSLLDEGVTTLNTHLIILCARHNIKIPSRLSTAKEESNL